MGTTLLPSPEPLFSPGSDDDFETQVPAKKSSKSGFREPLFLPGSDSDDDFETQVPISPLQHAEDFGITPVPDGGPSQTGTNQPTEAKESLGSLSKERGEFHFTISDTHLTLLYTAWIWGQRPPSPTDSKLEGQPSMIG